MGSSDNISSTTSIGCVSKRFSSNILKLSIHIQEILSQPQVPLEAECGAAKQAMGFMKFRYARLPFSSAHLNYASIVLEFTTLEKSENAMSFTIDKISTDDLLNIPIIEDWRLSP
jgi:hypothetical protein